MSASAFGPFQNPVNNSSVGPSNFIQNKEDHGLGLKSIYSACRKIYPDQTNPLQVTALRKFWMGGPDPLDFINMYLNPGAPELQSPAHWHYVTNGLSDLYGDSRLHSNCGSTDGPSGFGFELTLRVRKEPNELSPPTWPAHLLQSLARYVFYSQAQLMSGDHIPWPSALNKQPFIQDLPSQINKPSQGSEQTNLDELEQTKKSIAMAAAATAASILAANNHKTMNASLAALTNPSTYASMVAAALAAVNSTNSNGQPDICAFRNSRSSQNDNMQLNSSNDSHSRIHHMLLIEDPQLQKITTPYGYVQFLQIVGLCDEELRLVQRWTGSHVAELMSRLPETGGKLLVTDMRRSLSLFELHPNLVDYINETLKREGSNLSGVTIAYFAWSSINLDNLNELLPGELESCRQRRHTQRLSSSSSVLSASMLNKNFKFDRFSSKQTSHTPTELTVSKPVAMDTDEATVFAITKKQSANDNGDDDEFVDVVGDDVPHRRNPYTAGNENNLLHAAASTSLLQETPSLKLFRYGSFASKDLPASMSRHNFTQATGNTDLFSNGQTISAPGGFSAWCSRIGPQYNIHPQYVRHNLTRTAENSPLGTSGIGQSNTPNELHSTVNGALGFRVFNTEQPNTLVDRPSEFKEIKGNKTPGSTGDGSAPCTPLAHLSLSPASLDLLPTRVIDYLDVHLCREAGEMLPLAVNDRLRHGRHFTFLNANYPEHAITLVPSGVSGSFVTEDTPYVARGPWLQILLTDDFLEQLEFQFSCLLYPDEVRLPLVFRWPERHLRICLVDPPVSHQLRHDGTSFPNHQSVQPKALAGLHNWMASTTLPEKLGVLGLSNNVTRQQLPSEIVPHQINPDNFSSLLSLFPPGCIPPPNVLATVVSAASNACRYQSQQLTPGESDHSSSPRKSNDGVIRSRSPSTKEDFRSNFLPDAMRPPTSRQQQPSFPQLMELMRAAMCAYQQQNHDSSQHFDTINASNESSNSQYSNTSNQPL